MAMAKGACGDYVVSNPVAHLNGLTAILLEREQARPTFCCADALCRTCSAKRHPLASPRDEALGNGR